MNEIPADRTACRKNERQMDMDLNGNPSCPMCGENMEAITRQVITTYPSPPLERFVCTGRDCGHVRYVKLNSLSKGGNKPYPAKRRAT